MANGVRNSIWTLFFLAGMAFMATLIFMIRPELFSNTPVREKPGSTVILGGASKRDGQRSFDGRTQQIHVSRVDGNKTEPIVAKINKLSAPEQPNTDTEASPVPQLAETPHASEAKSEQARPNVRATDINFNLTAAQIAMVQPGHRVFGHVKLIGELPPPKEYPLGENYCGPTVSTTLTSRVYLRAEDGSLADVLVAVTEGARDQRAQNSVAPAWITINKCQFDPYITAIQLGQRAAIINLDDQFQDVHIRNGSGVPAHYFPLSSKSDPALVDFYDAGLFLRIESGIRPYMVCYVCVLPNPFFAITRTDGNFEINNLPPGDYTITATHRKAGSISRKVNVTDQQSPQLEFTFEVVTEVAQQP